MESILVLTHTDETNTLTQPSLEAVSAGRELAARIGAELTIGIVAKHGTRPAAQLAGAAKRLLAVQGEAFAQPRFASDAAACEALWRATVASIVIAPQSSRFARVMAAVAHRTGGAIDTHVTAIGGAEKIEASRWFYRQRIEAVFTRDARPWFLMLDAGTHTAFAGDGTQLEPEEIAITAVLPELRTQVIGIKAAEKDAQTIRPDARLLLVAGAGWTRKQSDGQMHAAEAGKSDSRVSLTRRALRWARASLLWTRAQTASPCCRSLRT